MSADAAAAPLRATLDTGLSELNARTSQPQHVVVVGGGMAGISTAYWLGRAGNSVTVLEAAAAPAPAAASAGVASTPVIPGGAASYTGLLAPSSSLAPFFARPQMFRAQKVQWCPRTQYLHPNFRVGLFASGSNTGATRMGIVKYASRKHFLPAVTRLYGLAMWNQELVKQVSREWGGQQEQINGTLAVVYDDRTFADMLQDAATNRTLVGEEATAVVAPDAVSARTTRNASTPLTASRVYPLPDRDVLVRLPSLEPKQFTMAGVVHYQDEVAVDHVAFLARMRQEATEKYGVRFQYDTTVTALTTEGQQQQSSASTAVVPAVSSSSNRIVAAQTSRGPVSGDAFVLCAGAHSKLLVHASHLPGVQQVIPTFTTKTHHVTFPNPDTPADRIFPPATVLLPETHTQLTAFQQQVRVSSGHEFNALDRPELPRAATAARAVEEAETGARGLQPRLDTTRLQTLLHDVSGVFPRVDKAMVAQASVPRDQRSIPSVSLRTWSYDGQPLLGRYASPLPNLFVNGAHGHLGWTHALAAGQHVSNIVSGLPTIMQQEAFDPRRFDVTK